MTTTQLSQDAEQFYREALEVLHADGPSIQERAVGIGERLAQRYFIARRGKGCGPSQANLSQDELAAVCALAAEMALRGGK